MLYDELINRRKYLSVIGLGYVGLPLAISFSQNVNVIGFDTNINKVQSYLNNKSINGIPENSTLNITYDEKYLKNCNFHIIAVPTPINNDKTPDLGHVIEASKIVGRNLTVGSIVVYESTVYPGVTEDICIPILESTSSLKCGEDFWVGYSPERINPADEINKLEKIVKIVSGQDNKTLDIVAQVYELIIKAGVYKAENIKIAEAAKIIENCQRDINIAFMNELSIIFNKMQIDVNQILKAAKTKWNFIDFVPGLVGGHCIGVDPYYLTYKANQLGLSTKVITAGRELNENMSKYIVENIIKKLIKANKTIKGARIGILGVTFKENCPDTRNSKVIDIINELKEYEVIPIVTDPKADSKLVEVDYNIKLHKLDELFNLDALIIAVPHNDYLNLSITDIENLFYDNIQSEIAATYLNNSSYFKQKNIIIDIKGILNKEEIDKSKYIYWSL